jgi:hypothetical protein
MARTGWYGHDADGNRPAERAKKYGYDACIVSENIGYQYSSALFTPEALAQGFVEGCKESPGHRKNLLDPDITQTGVGLAEREPGTFFAVQMFGRPSAEPVSFEVSNGSGASIEYRLGERAYPLPPGVTRGHEVCRAEDLVFRLPAKPGASQGEEFARFSPKDGERFRVVSDSGAPRVRRQ